MNENRWSVEIQAWATSLRAVGRPESTVRLRVYHLRRFGDDMGRRGPWRVTPDDVVRWFAEHQWARETRRSMLSSVRTFYRWAMRTGRTTSDPTVTMDAVEPSPPNPRPLPDHLYREALARADTRERVMLRLAGDHGLRRAEVAQVHSRDLMQDLMGWTLVVHGKGSKDRLVPLTDHVARELRSLEDGWAFPGSDGGHLSPAWVGRLVARLLPEGWSMHTLRHRCATRMYAVDRDLLTVGQVLGHSSTDTTKRYVRTPDDARRRLVNAVAV